MPFIYHKLEDYFFKLHRADGFRLHQCILANPSGGHGTRLPLQIRGEQILGRSAD